MLYYFILDSHEKAFQKLKSHSKQIILRKEMNAVQVTNISPAVEALPHRQWPVGAVASDKMHFSRVQFIAPSCVFIKPHCARPILAIANLNCMFGGASLISDCK